MSMRLALLLAFVGFPFLEIALLIKAGAIIGFWPTIAILVGSAVLGMIVIREQGMTMVGRMFAAMNEGRFPFEPLLDSYALITAGFLLIMPGLLSDAIGLLLLVPLVRKAGIRWALAGLIVRGKTSSSAHPQQDEHGTVIEGTFERLHETDETRKKLP
jgi:UPF0716 protein FxsA